MTTGTSTPLELPPSDSVALLDIDGTLIDQRYQVTDPTIYQAIADAQDAGWVLGLSSDSPYKAMCSWHHHFGLNGPIIAEKGAHVVTRPHDDNEQDEQSKNHFQTLRDRVIARLEERAIKIWHGNPVDLIKNGNRFPAAAEQGEVVVLINAHRKHSVGYFVRAIGAGGLMHIAREHTDAIATDLRALYDPTIAVDEDLNHEHGLMIIGHAAMHKRIGSLTLMKQLGLGRFSMIGNSYADYVGSDIANHLAVGDATPQLKAVADFIANKPASGGAAQALNTLTQKMSLSQKELI